MFCPDSGIWNPVCSTVSVLFISLCTKDISKTLTIEHTGFQIPESGQNMS